VVGHSGHVILHRCLTAATLLGGCVSYKHGNASHRKPQHVSLREESIIAASCEAPESAKHMRVALLWLVLCRPAAASHLGRPNDRAAHQVSAAGLQERWATVGACAGWRSADHQSCYRSLSARAMTQSCVACLEARLQAATSGLLLHGLTAC
jgi:hypothetical protein